MGLEYQSRTKEKYLEIIVTRAYVEFFLCKAKKVLAHPKYNFWDPPPSRTPIVVVP